MAWLRKAVKKYGARWALGVVLTLAAALYTNGIWHSHAIERQDTIIADLRMRLEGPAPDPRIVIVDIDPKSLAAVGRFPWSRDVMARLVDRLAGHYGTRAIGFDVSFPESDTSSGFAVLERLARRELKDVPGMETKLKALQPELDYDGKFARALAQGPVVLGYSVSPILAKGALPRPAFTVADLGGRRLDAYQAAGYEANIARLQEAARGAGSFTVDPDADGVVRTVPLLQRIGDGYYPRPCTWARRRSVRTSATNRSSARTRPPAPTASSSRCRTGKEAFRSATA
jgi:adenylate cyclase